MRVAQDPRFKRQGDDVVVPVAVPLAVALLGGEAMVPTLGDPVRMKIPAGTQGGQRFRIKGKGVPKKGDLYAEIGVEIPKELDDETREKLEELRKALGG